MMLPEPQKDLNILLVEDNDLDVEILKRCLKKMNISGALVRAYDGQEALEILKADLKSNQLPQPYVILLDINMPRMNGHEFLEAVRSSDDLKAARVIIFSTSDNKKDVERAYQNNANGYIVKPNGSSELQDIMHSLRSFWEICEHPLP